VLTCVDLLNFCWGFTHLVTLTLCLYNVSHEICQWLFFQNVIQVQLHGSKNPIVVYQEIWLQRWLRVNKLLSAATSHRFNWSGPSPGT